MEPLFNFKIQSKKAISKLCLNLGLKTFADTCVYVRAIPYGRNSNRTDFSLVLSEQKGTCSTKHALLSQLAIENNANDIKLTIGIYKMHHNNTMGIKNVLLDHNLKYIPDAHTYLTINKQLFDFTNQ